VVTTNIRTEYGLANGHEVHIVSMTAFLGVVPTTRDGVSVSIPVCLSDLQSVLCIMHQLLSKEKIIN